MTPRERALMFVEQLERGMGRPATGDDLRVALEDLSAVRGELAAIAGERDRAAQAQGSR